MKEKFANFRGITDFWFVTHVLAPNEKLQALFSSIHFTFPAIKAKSER